MSTVPTPELNAHMSVLQMFDSIYAGVLVMGLFYGLTLCSFSCLPLVGSYVFGTQERFSGGFYTTAVFVIAKVMTYGAMGALSGLLGSVVLDIVKPGWFFAAGGVLILGVGVVVWQRRSACRAHPDHRGDKHASGWRAYHHMAVMGVVTSLTPCLPLSAVLVYAAVAKSWVAGGSLALLFGLGSAASPLYYIGGAAGWLSGRIREAIPQHQNLMRKLSSIVLIMMGMKLLVLAFDSLSGQSVEFFVFHTYSDFALSVRWAS